MIRYSQRTLKDGLKTLIQCWLRQSDGNATPVKTYVFDVVRRELSGGVEPPTLTDAPSVRVFNSNQLSREGRGELNSPAGAVRPQTVKPRGLTPRYFTPKPAAPRVCRQLLGEWKNSFELLNRSSHVHDSSAQSRSSDSTVQPHPTVSSVLRQDVSTQRGGLSRYSISYDGRVTSVQACFRCLCRPPGVSSILG